MPTISMFYGIIVRMQAKDHNPPHIHAKYNEFIAVFNFDGEKTEGEFPHKQTRLIQAWIELHKDELLANWELAANGDEIFKIKPLD